jgi:prepilin-type N-terminal cleavage/methylation domain-containing protein
MLKGARGRRGFTLIETVVTVGIVATLAAVVVPQVVKQFDTGETARLQNDLKNIQSAVETFAINVRAMPGDLDDLVNKIVTIGNVDSTLNSSTASPAFAGTEDTFWKGPYLDQTITQASIEDFLTTGYGARIVDSFVCYDASNNEHGVSEATGTITGNNNAACPNVAGATQRFLAVQIIGLTCSTTAGSSFMALNELFDGVSETGAELNGRVRCEAAAFTGNKDTDVDVVFFLAVPLT